MPYLTKSRFTTAITCPSKLTYLDDRAFANANNENEFLKALADGGHQVGALAKCIYPDGIEIDAAGHDAQVEQTRLYLEQENIVLFEAAIRVGNLFIRADMLRKHGSTLELYEVKAKGYDSQEGETQVVGKRGGITSEFKPYIYDVAFQRHVLKLAFPEMEIRSFLVMPDQSRVCTENALAQRLQIIRVSERNLRIEVDPSLKDGVMAKHMLNILPVDGYIDLLITQPLEAGGYSWEFSEGITELAERINGLAYSPRSGTHCRTCEFRAGAKDRERNLLDGRVVCWSRQFGVDPTALTSGTVFDLYNFRGTDSVLAGGKFLLPDLEHEDVKLKLEKEKISSSHRQWLQCEESRDVIRVPFVIPEALAAKLTGLIYPIHFIDFETSTPALPFHEGRRPYEQLLFQFSHHRAEPDGSFTHASQYLDSRKGIFPNFDAVRALAAAFGTDNGSVIHWWTHERTVLKKIREQLAAVTEPMLDRDALIAFIDSLTGDNGSPGRLVDLGQHIVAPFVFFPGTKGSSSIKKVLPALLKFSPSLQARYQNPIYGAADEIASMNFQNQAWVHFDVDGQVIDPYKLLSAKFNDPDLDTFDSDEEESTVVADGGAAMVAYGLLQSNLLDTSSRNALEQQLLRYCELDTLAMVMAWQGLREYLQV